MLSSVRILDLSRLLPGPACTWFLQSLGAQVDRVETLRGDFTRYIPPMFHGTGVYYASISRGKRSLSMNFRHAKTAELLIRLLAHYDVLVEGFKPGTLEAIGLEPEKLLVQYPRLIIARLSGYGQQGLWKERPGHDINYIALSGILAAQEIGSKGYSLPAVQVADMSGAMMAAMTISAALVERNVTGKGRVLDISLTQAAMALNAPMITGLSAEKRDALPGGEGLTGGMDIYGTYLCGDGKWLSLGGIEPKFQAILLQHVKRLRRADLEALFISQDRQHWLELFAGACTAPVLGVSELAEHPQIQAMRIIEEWKGSLFVRPPEGRLEGGVPALGEHTKEILTEAGCSSEEITAWKAEQLL